MYRLGGQAAPLVYYIAYYLPAALLGKLGGWLWAHQVLFVWSWIGLILAMLWFIILNRRAAFTVVLLFDILWSRRDWRDDCQVYRCSHQAGSQGDPELGSY